MMYHETLFDRIGLCREGRDNFDMLHKRLSDKAFADSLEASFTAFDNGDEAFEAYLNEFAEREAVAPEILNLYIYTRLSERTLAEYKKRAIDEDVFYDTMREIVVDCKWCIKRKGICGIGQPTHRRWMRNHLTNRIYRFGRLQFEPIPSPCNETVSDVTIEKGDTVISTHIPAFEKLDAAECESSYDRARAFFRIHYRLDPVVFYCNSWLLHPWISKDMPPTSNIVDFQKRYKTIDITDRQDAVISLVLDGFKDDPNDYPENTSLQRAAKARIIEKRPIGTAAGLRL